MIQKKRICQEHVRQQSHKKFCFYHLPTRGQAGIKLEDVDKSPMYLIFLLFHVIILPFLDVLQSFYSNLDKPIDIVPSASCCFLLVFYFAENQYQTESKHNESFCGFFLDQKTPYGPRKYPRGAPGEHNLPGRAWRPRRAQVGCAHLGGLPHRLFVLWIPQYSRNPRGVDENQFHSPQVPKPPDPI